MIVFSKVSDPFDILMIFGILTENPDVFHLFLVS